MSKRIEKVYPLHINRFDALQCINGSYSEVEILNEIICKLNKVGKLTNDVIYDWNNVMKWYLEGGTSGGGGSTNNEAVTQLRNDLRSQQAGKGASLIGIRDIYNLYTATNVEDALAEVIRKANTALQLQTDGAELRTDLRSNSSGKGASLIGVNDTENLFTGTTVEEVLKEIYLHVDGLVVDSPTELKNDLASTAINKGASMVGINDVSSLFNSQTVEGALKESIERANSAFQSASEGKQLLSTSLATKGKTVSPTAPFQDFANAIETIETGGGSDGDGSVWGGEALATSVNENFVKFDGTNGSFKTIPINTSLIPFVPDFITVQPKNKQLRYIGVWTNEDYYVSGNYNANYSEGSGTSNSFRVPYNENELRLPTQSGGYTFIITAVKKGE